MIPIDGNFIRQVAPRFSGSKEAAQDRIINAISGAFASTLDEFDINTRLRIAHFMGQVTHECAGFRTTEEFASGEAYEGRKDLGNTEKDDGPHYKGRGLIQLTGRANYGTIGKRLGLGDRLVKDPDLAGEPLTALRIACDYWKYREINDPADEDDLIEVTRRVNGRRLLGLEERRHYYVRAKAALAAIEGLGVSLTQDGAKPALQRGSYGESVGELQALLRRHGFPIAIDAHFGAAAQLAVITFQTRESLAPDGIVGARTWERLNG